jgi:hypothetical protein
MLWQTEMMAWPCRVVTSESPRPQPSPRLVNRPLACLALALLLAGCGQRLAEVRGRVTFQGKPVSGGAAVLFRNSAQGTHILAKLDQDGNFRVEMAEGYGLPPARYEVAVLPPPMPLSAQFIEKHRGQSPHLAAFPNIPLRYRDPKTSGLGLDLTSKGAVLDIDMQTDR